MVLALPSIFLLSGAAALLFETLWFRQAGLMLGNSVWTSSLVTASFMGGLALGSGVAARYGERLRRPLLTYARLEATIGLVGVGLVALFPVLTQLAAPLLGRMTDHQGALNAVRLLTAFILMLVPATAMGATLPILVRAVTARGTDFGRALGLLYGWNTLGAVIGALLGEWLLVPRFGVLGTGLVAGLFNGMACLGAMAVCRWSGFGSPVALQPASPDPAETASRLARHQRLVLAAAFLCGATLLALEVVWFRFLRLFVTGTSLIFSTMLAMVLLGIGAGGLVVSLWLKWQRDAHRFLPFVALATGVAATLAYFSLPESLPGGGRVMISAPSGILAPAAHLMLPTSLLSGVLFTLLGRLLKESTPGDTRATGLLTLANTTGAMLGALVAGFVLLPRVGIERSFLILASAYGVVALLLGLARWPENRRARREIQAYGLAGTLFVALLAFFPLGLMQNHYLRVVASRWPGSKVVASREGLTETILCLREDVHDEPYAYRLVTDGYSMSGTKIHVRRYMGFFVWLPMSIHPEAKRALLISYGVGVTAKALANTRGLDSIDVVDISRDILDVSRIILPAGGHPLDDPRVRVHIEDGRFFLATTNERYDLITSEPPPPRNAGVVNLYSREHFRLIHDRLAEGGVASYWLPVYQLRSGDAKAIVHAFCDAFEDCTLWMGHGAEWVLVGTRGARGPVPEEAFTRQWRDPTVAAELKATGIEVPEALGALFLADAEQLREFSRDTPPVDDDHPQRLSLAPGGDFEYFESLIPTELAEERFARSDFIRRLWPPALRERTLPFFQETEPLNRLAWAGYGGKPVGLPHLYAALSSPRLKTPALWIMQNSEDLLKIVRTVVARGGSGWSLDLARGTEAMANRDYRAAERLIRDAQRRAPSIGRERLAQWRVLALAMAGETGKAKEIVLSADEWIDTPDVENWGWLSTTFGLPNPFPTPPPADAKTAR